MLLEVPIAAMLPLITTLLEVPIAAMLPLITTLARLIQTQPFH